MDIKENRDNFIRQKLKEDTTILQPSLEVCVNYLNDTKIKQKKYTRKQKNIILFILLLLAISCAFNIYLLSEKDISNNQLYSPLSSITNDSKEPSKKSEQIIIENKNTSEIPVLENTTLNTNEITNTAVTIPTNTITNDIKISASTKNTLDSSEFQSEEFKKILELYSLGIYRIYETNNDEKEINTIKLLTVLRYLDYCSQKQNNKTGTFSAKYAALKDNVYLCLNELTKTNYPSGIISTYEDFVKYHNNSNSFAYGSNSSLLTNEKYEILELKPYEASNNLYNIETKIKRIAKYNENTTVEDTFNVKFVVSINSDYTYSKYKIISMYFENENKNVPNKTYNLTDTSMFTQDEISEIKDQIIAKQRDEKEYFIYFDNVTKESTDNYSISYRIIADNTLVEEKVKVSKKDSKLSLDFK